MKKTFNTLFAGVLAVTYFFAPAMTSAATPTSGAAGTSGTTASSAATPQAIMDQEIQLLRQDIRDQRRQVVAANLPLSTEESAKFWPVYDRYIAETIKINDARFERIKAYAANYATMTDQQASDHITKVFEADKAVIDLRLKYLPDFEKAVGKKKAAMFIQMDRRIQMMLDLQIASRIPLINPK